MIKEAINKIVRGNDLTESEMEITMLDILAGETTPAQVGAILSALRMKGETVDEITGAVLALKSRLTPFQLNNNLVNLDRDDINLEEETILATSETRDKGTNTFSVSSATIFVVAGGGVKVVRQGELAKIWIHRCGRCLAAPGRESGYFPYRCAAMHRRGGHRVSVCTHVSWGHAIC